MLETTTIILNIGIHNETEFHSPDLAQLFNLTTFIIIIWSLEVYNFVYKD